MATKKTSTAKKIATKKPAKKTSAKPLDERAVERLEIVIQAAAAKARATVGEAVQQMRGTGMKESAIRDRLQADLDEGGQLMADLRNFAAAKVPGWTGDIVSRFANDTLSDFERRQAYRKRTEEEKAEKSAPERQAALDQQKELIEKAGVDVGNLTLDDKPEPPPDAPLTSEWRWVAVLDANVCGVCEGNHGRVKTLREWAEIGEPRSGTCAGAERCRCILIPEDSLKGAPIPPLLRPRKR